MTSNIQNPFLTADVNHACTHARTWYLDTLARMQMFGGQPIDLLRATKGTFASNLEMYRKVAMEAAFAGDIPTASTQLAYIVKEWGLYKAYDDLITVHGTTYLDPCDPDTANDFDQVVQGRVVFWATELTNKLTEGVAQRQTDQVRVYMERNAHLYGAYQQMNQEQGNALRQAHQENRQYADTAFHGVQQAQQGAQWMMQGVEKLNEQASQNVFWFQQGVQGMYAHGADVMKAAIKTQQEFTKSVEQNLPREMEKAQARTERRKIITRGIVALVLILAVPALLALAWFLLRMTLHF